MMKKSIVSALAVTAMMVSGTALAAKYKVIEVTNGGSIKGKVSYSGSASVKKYPIAKDTQVCGTGERTVPEIRVSDGALMDVVVYLHKVKEGKAFPAEAKKITINQKGCEFQPLLGTMANQGEMEAVNSDSVLHNLHTYELIGRARRTVANVSQPDKGNVFSKKIKLRKGNVMKVECDAHDFMHSHIFVGKNPYYAIVGSDGSFALKDIPAGKYTIKSWHSKLGEKKQKVSVSAGGGATANFSY